MFIRIILVLFLGFLFLGKSHVQWIGSSFSETSEILQLENYYEDTKQENETVFHSLSFLFPSIQFQFLSVSQSDPNLRFSLNFSVLKLRGPPSQT
ncbi:hypothetical protein LEP1GSC202_2528 [Leptospira yanagawae serovar Saopaulo str. Sao Paulo = ATCC 700523]|uniref:Uncharacterized protein n=1 Tax=Leptospira yanagawae serovar Saopaulo str. Sao Paulo = ATCC 700523 TaxID=1249483 RepID=A0A5E8H746_9LEPT|nr:hypothetical protein [Leptospira yanagawae]EOQ87115.1 hypothetical protein LEP1GSC202_2528 [Leptospira yanagawae serovar Saopaulo str. Sao Paulo = ATCC 700523]